MHWKNRYTIYSRSSTEIINVKTVKSSDKKPPIKARELDYKYNLALILWN